MMTYESITAEMIQALADEVKALKKNGADQQTPLSSGMRTNRERLVITSHTNAAVDAVLKAAKKGLSEADVHGGAIVRVGTPKEPDSELADITVDAIAGRKSAELKTQKAVIQADLEKATQEESHWTALRQRYGAVEETQTILLKAQRQATEAEERSLSARRQVVAATDQIAYVQARL